METQFILLTLMILIVNIYWIIKLTSKTGLNSEENKLRNGFEWLFQLESSYLSTIIFDFAVPFYTESEFNDQIDGPFNTMIMRLRYFRRRPSVIPYRGADVNHGRRSSSTDYTRVESLRRVHRLDNIAVGLYNALLRDIFQGVPRPWHNRHNCQFCRAIYQNLTPCITLPRIRQWLQLTIPDGMEEHTDTHIRQFLIQEISNARPHDCCCPGQRRRNLWTSTQRLTFLFPYYRFHDNRRVTFDSPSFLVRGLRLCLRVYPNGIGDGHMSHMSVFLVLADTHILSYNDRRFPLAIRVTLVANQRRYTNMAYTVVVRNPRSWYLNQSSYVNEFGFEMFASHHLLEHYFTRDGVVTFIIELDD